MRPMRYRANNNPQVVKEWEEFRDVSLEVASELTKQALESNHRETIIAVMQLEVTLMTFFMHIEEINQIKSLMRRRELVKIAYINAVKSKSAK